VLTQEIEDGWACRFCERKFVDGKGNRICLGKLSICSDCKSLIPWKEKSLGYNVASYNVMQNNSDYELRKSEILEQIQMECEDDNTSWKLDKTIKREQNKELFKERWFPKFKDWLEEDIKWDSKKQCYTLLLEKDGQPSIIDFYPSGNKVLIRKENLWIDGGMGWLAKNVLPEEFRQEAKD
jgi:hypothetical protein